MRTFFATALIFLFTIALISGCLKRDKPDTIATEVINEGMSSNSEKVRLIFYNMYLPTEMSRLFEELGVNYMPEILNPSENFSLYDDEPEIALNLGLYGVDLSYCRLFDQNAETAKYFSTIQLLYGKLGIPPSYFHDLLTGLEQYYNNKDSLARFAGGVYEHADNFLRENNKDVYAAMIITGGWIESIYLASKIAEANPDNIEIKERIAEQKYSLNSLISLLNNYQENYVVAGHLLMLKGLKKSFDQIDIYYKHDIFRLDTINKLFSVSDYNINFSPDLLKEISESISEIRSEIVN